MTGTANRLVDFLSRVRATALAALRDEESGPMKDKYELEALPPFVVAALALGLVVMWLVVAIIALAMMR